MRRNIKKKQYMVVPLFQGPKFTPNFFWLSLRTLVLTGQLRGTPYSVGLCLQAHGPCLCSEEQSLVQPATFQSKIKFLSKMGGGLLFYEQFMYFQELKWKHGISLDLVKIKVCQSPYQSGPKNVALLPQKETFNFQFRLATAFLGYLGAENRWLEFCLHLRTFSGPTYCTPFSMQLHQQAKYNLIVKDHNF